MTVNYIVGDESNFSDVEDLGKKVGAISKQYEKVAIGRFAMHPMIVACNGECDEEVNGDFPRRPCTESCEYLIWFDPSIYDAKTIAELVDVSIDKAVAVAD
jgi:hypothetical protein